MVQVAVVAHERKLSASAREGLRTALQAAGLDGPWFMLPKAKKATAAVRKALDDGAEVLVACGGDGTVRAAAQGLVGTGVALAVMPTGTANLFANGFALPFAPADVVGLITSGDRRTIDSAVCNDMTFNVMAGTGFDAGMIDDADASKERLGMLAYLRSGWRSARSEETFRAEVTVDGSVFFEGTATCVLVGNIGTLKGGLEAFPDASPTDGRLDIAVLTATGLKEWASVMLSALRHKQTASAHVQIGQGADIDVRLDAKRRFELDGGAKGTSKRLRFGVRPNSLVLCAPTA